MVRATRPELNFGAARDPKTTVFTARWMFLLPSVLLYGSRLMVVACVFVPVAAIFAPAPGLLVPAPDFT